MQTEGALASLSQSYRTVQVPRLGTWIRKLVAFSGPAFLVAVGYMDPGNWATDLAGGSQFGYTLIWVIFFSNFIAFFLQILSARLGIVMNRDLAQACRDHYSKPYVILQWIFCEAAICAADLAEVIGTAIALNLLFHVSLPVGVALTSLDVIVILAVQKCGFRYLEAIVVLLMAVVLGCFAVNLSFAHPHISEALSGFIPNSNFLKNHDLLYIAIGILGATVMPHNLYLHSSVVQTRQYSRSPSGKREALKFTAIDTFVALSFAVAVNAAILVTAAAVFFKPGRPVVVDIEKAFYMISPAVGVGVAGIVFGIALLASGQSSAISATLTGQIIMEGFLNLKLPGWARRLITRSIAILPALAVVCIYGSHGISKLLILSQVILSMQLPFAIFPLVRFTSDPRKMGEFVNRRWVSCLGYVTLTAIVTLNCKILFDFI